MSLTTYADDIKKLFKTVKGQQQILFGINTILDELTIQVLKSSSKTFLQENIAITLKNLIIDEKRITIHDQKYFLNETAKHKIFKSSFLSLGTNKSTKILKSSAYTLDVQLNEGRSHGLKCC